MKHICYPFKFVAVLCVTIALFALTLPTKPEQAQPIGDQTGGGIALQPPAFLKSVHAADSTVAVTATTPIDFSFLLDEAGVTAYTKLDQPLDLAKLQSYFKIIRQQTDQFISGIMIVPGYEQLTEFNDNENVEVQVFLHRDGWIVVYLTKYQSASALFDWVNYDAKRLSGTLIEDVVRLLATKSGISDFNIAYYDFRYPEATHLILAAERADIQRSDGSFLITIPQGFTVYDNSWSLAQFNHTRYGSKCNLDDQDLGSVWSETLKWKLVTGEFPSAKFSLGVTHKLSIGYSTWDSDSSGRAYCGIAIVYQEAAQ